MIVSLAAGNVYSSIIMIRLVNRDADSSMKASLVKRGVDSSMKSHLTTVALIVLIGLWLMSVRELKILLMTVSITSLMRG